MESGVLSLRSWRFARKLRGLTVLLAAGLATDATAGEFAIWEMDARDGVNQPAPEEEANVPWEGKVATAWVFPEALSAYHIRRSGSSPPA